MKILYAIQGTGNGHLSRATEIIPILNQKADVHVLISGGIESIEYPFNVHYRFQGLGFIFGKKGGIDIWNTIKKIRLKTVIKEIKSIPVKEYDLIINDFEPISAWAGKIRNVPVISLSHQAAIMDSLAPKTKNNNKLEKFLLNNYAPSKHKFGFHFKTYNKFIFTPVIRKEIRKETPVKKNHYTVYLPAYSDEKIIKTLSKFSNIRWHVFSKHSKETYLINNILITPIHNKEFIKSLVSCKGVLCGAGFETPAEALFLNKKLLVIPMKLQFEQKCNAKALQEMGVTVIKKFNRKNDHLINEWLNSDKNIKVDYPDYTEEIIDYMLSEFSFRNQFKNSLHTKIEMS